MDFRPLDIHVRCLHGMKKLSSIFCRKRVYVSVSIVGSNSSSRQETPSAGDHKGKADLVWNYPMRFYLDESMLQENRLMILFQIRRRHVLGGGSRYVGEVCVPIKDVLNQLSAAEQVHGVYQVARLPYERSRSGESSSSSLLYCSYKFGDMIRAKATETAAAITRKTTFAGCRENVGARSGISVSSVIMYPGYHEAHPPPSAPYIGYLDQ